MRTDKRSALRLRKLGKSYREIRDLLGVPKSTLSDWLKGIRWSQKIRIILSENAKTKSSIRLRKLSKIRGEHLRRLYKEARFEAKQEFEYFKLHPLFTTGVAIYWGKGDKSSPHIIRVSNIDPKMIKMFVRFLKKICGVPSEKIRAYILLYPDLNKNKCKSFWVKESGLTRDNFTKCVTIRGRHKTRRIKYGVCTVGVMSAYLKQKMNIWLELLPNELAKKEYYPRE